MSPEILNHTRLKDNACFGCGALNKHGLKIELSVDPEHPDRLIGHFTPQDSMTGFPGITHGGAVYTALDCLGAWVPTVLKPDIKAIWILRSANVTYHRPALQGQPLILSGRIQDDAGRWQAVTVAAEALNADRELLVSGVFKVIPLPPDKFINLVGVDELPPNWQAFLS